MIARLYRAYRPFRFFGSISLLLAIVSLILFIPIGLEFVRTGLVPRFPTLITSGFIMIAAIQALFTGLQLQTQVYKDRQDFEMWLIQADREKRRMMGEKTDG